MLAFRTIVSLLWLIAVVNVCACEENGTSDEIAENPTNVKTAFTRQAMEISDLLRMFTTLINKADAEEGRELGLPEITTSIPQNLESVSLEELFDRFETAAQSFRTRFLKYLMTTESPSSSVTPTVSTVFELREDEDLPKLVYEYENVAEVDPLPDSEIATEQIINPNDKDISNEKTTVAFILSNSEEADSGPAEYSTSADISDSGTPSEESSAAFILTNGEMTDSEMDADYRTSTAAPDAINNYSSGDTTTLAFILSEKLNQGRDEASIVGKLSDEDIIITLTPIAQGSSRSFNGEPTSGFFPCEDFTNPIEKLGTEVTTDDQSTVLNGKSRFVPRTETFTNGATTFILESGEDGSGEISFSTDCHSEEVDTTPFTTSDDSSEQYTLMTFSTTEGEDSGEFDGEIEDSSIYDSEEASEAVSTTDDSDDEAGEAVSTTEDFDAEGSEAVSTTDDSDDEDGEVISTTDDSEEETSEVASTEDDSDEETDELFSTTEDYSSKTTRVRSAAEDNEKLAEELSAEEMTELIKILRAAAKKYETVENARFSGNSKDFEIYSKRVLQVPEQSTENVMGPLSSPNFKVVEENSNLKVSQKRKNSKILDNSDNFSDRMGLIHDKIVSTHLDVTGVPRENYPDSTNILPTSFTCEGKESPGLYADLETRCQAFHVCWPHRMESYLCPVGSTFNQEILSCDYWYNSTCSLSPDYYGVNLRLKGYATQFEDGFYEKFEDVYPYDGSRVDFSHPIFKEMKFLPFKYEITNRSVKGRGIESGTEIDYNGTVKIDFDQNSTLPTQEDLTHQETTDDMVDSVKDRFRELLKSYVKSENSKNTESSDDLSDDASLYETILQERRYVYEKMSKSRLGRSGPLPEEAQSVEAKLPKVDQNPEVSHKGTYAKLGKEQIAPIVFKALETAENVVTKGILPMTRELLTANYIKLYKAKKL